MNEYIVFELDGKIYRLPTHVFKIVVWQKLPPLLKDPESEEAKNPKNQLMRIGVKAALRGILPNMLQSVFGEKAPVPPPRVDLLQWTMQLLVNIVGNFLSSRVWHVEAIPCESCGEGVYNLLSVSSDAQEKRELSAEPVTPSHS